jgi:hypothetical protein
MWDGGNDDRWIFIAVIIRPETANAEERCALRWLVECRQDDFLWEWIACAQREAARDYLRS